MKGMEGMEGLTLSGPEVCEEVCEEVWMGQEGRVEDSWEVLGYPDSYTHTPYTPYRSAPLYSEVLLRPCPCPHTHTPEVVAALPTARVWQPTILVRRVSAQRLGVQYVRDARDQPIEEDDDDYSYYQSQEYTKGSVALTRSRCSTMLKPAAMEKKLARIAAKMPAPCA
mmetsp:Transcript_28905/g.64171  ORF Transcript_28905/g.64171 Transcript_28905/m.64171 type:complete len:168 (+) Transcript_28905:1-504(+)